MSSSGEIPNIPSVSRESQEPNDSGSAFYRSDPSSGPHTGQRTAKGAASPSKSRHHRDVTTSSDQAPPAVTELRARPSRWADEVDEDDQFISDRSRVPRESAPVISREAPRREKREPKRTERAPIPLRGAEKPSRFEGRESYRRDAERPFSSGKGGKGQQRVSPRATARNEVVPATRISPSELDEIAHMQETMARKAKERMKQKEEEEARLEAERKARCEAKLREIEERRKAKSSSTTLPNSIEEKVEPSYATESKREAFNKARANLRHQRERDRIGDEGIDSPIPIHAAQASNLSPNAREFIPSGPPAPPMHWQPYAPPHPVHPPFPPHMMPPHGQVPPMGHMPHQIPPGGPMPYPYQQYPPFPYGYPPPPHQMGNHHF